VSNKLLYKIYVYMYREITVKEEVVVVGLISLNRIC